MGVVRAVMSYRDKYISWIALTHAPCHFGPFDFNVAYGKVDFRWLKLDRKMSCCFQARLCTLLRGIISSPYLLI